MALDLRSVLATELRRHPRVAFQGLAPDREAWSRLGAEAPALVPFGRAQYHGGVWVLDWDHRLPSRTLTLRLYAYYDEGTAREGLRAMADRGAEIAAEDRFPEFDVPDFAGLPADEAYEAEMSPEAPLGTLRLVSGWRREVDPGIGRKAVDLVRRSEAFQDLRRRLRARQPGLGELEAAEWTPPCESGHSRWGLDVWFLTSFNGMTGEGRAFLVDLDEARVIRHRDFQFRTG